MEWYCKRTWKEQSKVRVTVNFRRVVASLFPSGYLSRSRPRSIDELMIDHILPNFRFDLHFTMSPRSL